MHFVSNDKNYQLRFNINAICAFESQAGISITELEGKVSLSLMRNLFWAGLLHENPDLTVNEAGEIMDGVEGDTEDLTLMISEALESQLAKKKVAKKSKAKGAKKGA